MNARSEQVLGSWELNEIEPHAAGGLAGFLFTVTAIPSMAVAAWMHQPWMLAAALGVSGGLAMVLRSQLLTSSVTIQVTPFVLKLSRRPLRISALEPVLRWLGFKAEGQLLKGEVELELSRMRQVDLLTEKGNSCLVLWLCQPCAELWVPVGTEGVDVDELREAILAGADHVGVCDKRRVLLMDKRFRRAG